MKRPHVPLAVKLAVLERQAFTDRPFKNEAERQLCRNWYQFCNKGKGMAARIELLLFLLFKGKPSQLDHDPALVLRKYNKRTGKFTPAANDPTFLIYRLTPLHLQKTTGRKPGAERTVTAKGSDTWLAKKFRKLEKPAKKQKRKIPSRPFRKGASSFAKRAGKGS